MTLRKTNFNEEIQYMQIKVWLRSHLLFLQKCKMRLTFQRFDAIMKM